LLLFSSIPAKKMRFAFSKHYTPPNIYKTHTHTKQNKKEKKGAYILTIHCSTVNN